MQLDLVLCGFLLLFGLLTDFLLGFLLLVHPLIARSLAVPLIGKYHMFPCSISRMGLLAVWLRFPFYYPATYVASVSAMFPVSLYCLPDFFFSACNGPVGWRGCISNQTLL
uniref:Uncharacterized protein n=1 Tax=Anopheles darlingi TaxID=43151 RepID=A0A2M4D8A2_ANODA